MLNDVDILSLKKTVIFKNKLYVFFFFCTEKCNLTFGVLAPLQP